MDKKFLSLNSNTSLSQSAAMADNPNNREEKEVKKKICSNTVSFSQKQALLKFMDENKQLALPNYKNEDLWRTLTNILNNLGKGAVKPTKHWQRVWKIWCTKVQNKRNDLSITLLDLQLLTFLKSIGEMEYEIKNLKSILFNFITNTEMKLDYKELISIAKKIPELKRTKEIINKINHLQDLELTEITYTSDILSEEKKLAKLISDKEQLDLEIIQLTNSLSQNQNQISKLREQMINVLNEIRNHAKALFSP